jgi:tetratricopeptide (TPR) repeat protein
MNWRLRPTATGLFLLLAFAGSPRAAEGPAERPEAEVQVGAAAADASDRGRVLLDPQDLPRGARVAYLLAGNRVRQGRPKEAMRFYVETMSRAPRFLPAYLDRARVYKALGDRIPAMDLVQKAREMAPPPRRAEVEHLLGEILRDEAFTLLEEGRRQRGLAVAENAQAAYLRALDHAAARGRLARRGGTYFRLGELAYLAFGDVGAARLYWQKLLDLHAPDPDRTWQRLMAPENEEKYRMQYRENTEIKTKLQTWKQWAGAYLAQLDSLRLDAAPVAEAPPVQDTPPMPAGPDRAGLSESAMDAPLRLRDPFSALADRAEEAVDEAPAAPDGQGAPLRTGTVFQVPGPGG